MVGQNPMIQPELTEEEKSVLARIPLLMYSGTGGTEKYSDLTYDLIKTEIYQDHLENFEVKKDPDFKNNVGVFLRNWIQGK